MRRAELRVGGDEQEFIIEQRRVSMPAESYGSDQRGVQRAGQQTVETDVGQISRRRASAWGCTRNVASDDGSANGAMVG